MAANLKIVQDVMIIIIKINGNVINYFFILVYFRKNKVKFSNAILAVKPTRFYVF